MGHEDAFSRPRLSARCQCSQRTFAGTHGNGRDAPIAAIPAIVKTGARTRKGNSVQGQLVSR